MIKRIKILIEYILLIVVFLLVSSVNSYAESNVNYTFPEGHISIEIPDTYTTLTRDNLDETDSEFILDLLQISRDDMYQDMLESNLYFDAIRNDFRSEIVMTITDCDFVSFDLVKNDDALQLLLDIMPQEVPVDGFAILDSNVFHTDEHSFLLYNIVYPGVDGEDVYNQEYIHVRNGKLICITAKNPNVPVPGAVMSIMFNMLESISFTDELEAKLPESNQYGVNAGEVYKDKFSGATFIVPTDWYQVEFEEPREALTAKFASKNDEFCNIFYGSYNIWKDLTKAEKSKYNNNRKNMDSENITLEEYKEILGEGYYDICINNIGGENYCIYNEKDDLEFYGLPITVYGKRAIIIKNGYILMYQMSGLNSDVHELEFEELIASANYDKETSKVFLWILMLIIVILVIAIITVILIKNDSFSNFKRNKNSKCVFCNEVLPKGSNFCIFCGKSLKSISCSKCGQVLPIGARYCHICGYEINENQIIKTDEVSIIDNNCENLSTMDNISINTEQEDKVDTNNSLEIGDVKKEPNIFVKALIWFMCLCIASAITVSIEEPLGAIPTMVLYILVFGLARFLCNKYSEYINR